MQKIKDLSLKYKLMTLLVGLTCLVLAAYGTLALSDFKNDKIAYILDSSLAHSRSVATQIKTELTNLHDQILFLTRGYDYTSKQFHPYTQSVFFNQRGIDGLYGYHFDTTSQNYKLFPKLQKPIENQGASTQLQSALDQTVGLALQNEIALRALSNSNYWLLGLKFSAPGETRPIVFVALLQNSEFMHYFRSIQSQDTFLINSNGHIVLQPDSQTYSLADTTIQFAINESLKVKGKDGTRELQNGDTESLIVSTSKVGYANLQVLSILPRSVALEAVRNLIIKSVIFLMLLVFTTVLASIFSSLSLTQSLKKLMLVTKAISQGDFNSKAQVTAQDEVGLLSQSINTMASDIQRLLLESEEKSRMEAELKTAQLVQSTLFPTEDLVSDSLEIRGHYQPASECSGDWWYYKTIGHKTYFYIGDATGHGVPAALLTCAARSAASTLDIMPDIEIEKVMTIFNQAIYNTAQGQLMMTFFMGCYDHSTHTLSYCNASHEPPFLLKKLERPLKRGDLIPLVNAVCPRLGESLKSTYSCAHVQFSPGDRIVLYTDGVTELKNANGDVLGERKLISLLLNCVNQNNSIQETIQTLNSNIVEFRKNHPLEDDVTYFFVERPKAS